MKLVYPAVFIPEKNGQYSVAFPDLNNSATCGDDIKDAMEMAIDLASGYVLTCIEEGDPIPKPTLDISKIKVKEGNFINYIYFDIDEYEKKWGKKTIERTISIPKYLDTHAQIRKIDLTEMVKEMLEYKVYNYPFDDEIERTVVLPADLYAYVSKEKIDLTDYLQEKLKEDIKNGVTKENKEEDRLEKIMFNIELLSDEGQEQAQKYVEELCDKELEEEPYTIEDEKV